MSASQAPSAEHPMTVGEVFAQPARSLPESVTMSRPTNLPDGQTNKDD